MSGSASWAKAVGAHEALQAASAWLAANPGRTLGSAPAAAAEAHRAKVVKPFHDGKGGVIAYIVDLDPEGYIVVPADDSVEPILTFSMTGHFTGSFHPEDHLSILLRLDIPERIEHRAEFSKDYSDRLARKWDKLKNAGAAPALSGSAPADTSIQSLSISVNPLITSRWNQGDQSSPYTYEYYTPNHYVTGCVATALGQIVRFFQYPSSASGSNTIHIDGKPSTASFSSSFDYSLMPNQLNDSTPLAQRQEVSKLLYDCGIISQMFYASFNSGSFVNEAGRGLVNLFGYRSADIKDTHDSDWASVLRNELSAGYPVELSIYASDGVGHAVVCDGWGMDSGSYRYHINMGWDGAYDNWYSLPDFTTGSYHWKYLSVFLYNIRPGDSVLRVMKSAPGPVRNGSTWGSAFTSISAALAVATPGAEVWVAAGSYPENITVPSGVGVYGGFAGTESTRDQRDPARNITTIDGGHSGAVVSIANCGSPTTIDGFTIKNGSATLGGGVYSYNSISTIQGNKITGNSASYGGGVFVSGTNSFVANNIISGNTATTGAGVYCQSADYNTYIVSNTIAYNTASGQGGGIACATVGSPWVVNNIVALNSSGVYADSSSAPTLKYNDVYGNTTYQYSGVSAGTGDISSDPQFANPMMGDFRIGPASPCIDQGSNSYSGLGSNSKDIDGQARFNNTTIDIGADESYGETYPRTWLVKQNSPYNGPGTDWAHAFHTIGQALSAAVSGDRIWVAAGSSAYVERLSMPNGIGVYGGFAGTENALIQRNPKAHPTIIDGNQAGTVVTFGSSVNNTSLDGFTIRNGRSGNGGGVLFYYSSPTVNDCIITGNTSTADGGGVSFDHSSGKLTNCTVSGNTATGRGGGIYALQGACMVFNCVITGNQAANGGGVNCYLSGTPTLTNNTIVSNAATTCGGGVSCDTSCYPSLYNNIVAFNSSGIWHGATGGTTTLRSNDVYGNTAYQYAGISAGTGDISEDPMFANRPLLDLHIRSNSLCRNRGYILAPGIVSYAVDIDGQARIGESIVDIGADESYGETYTAIYRVKSNSTTDGPGDGWSRAFHEATDALDCALAGDEVWVAAGTYTGSHVVNSGVGFYGGFSGIETTRASRAMRSNTTTLTAGGSGTVVELCGPADSRSRIEGFTVTGGGGTSAAGIKCDIASTPVVNACFVTGNSCVGIYCAAPAVITNCIIKSNSNASGAGGIICEWCSPTITNNVITSNDGGGSMGSAIGCYSGSPVIQNNVIMSHVAGAIWSDTNGPVVRNNDFYRNRSYDYYEHELDSSNLRVLPSFVDSANNDYHLKPGSPLLDAGLNTNCPPVDRDGYARPTDADGNGTCNCDIGAYESPAALVAIKRNYSLVDAVTLGGVRVTAVFPNQRMVYVESLDRSAGIGVYTTGSFTEGQLVNVTGSLATSAATGECYILADKPCTPAGGTSAATAIAMPVKSIGGGPAGLQRGVVGGVGLNNVGLLVRTSGRIQDIDDYYGIIDDGSGCDLWVLSPVKITVPITVEYISVTGVVSCGKYSNGTLYRVIKPRRLSDIVVRQ